MAQSDSDARENGRSRHALASFTNHRAVSPIIGVVLLVAVTVTLSAIVGTLVLGLTDGVTETAPSADIAFDATDDGAVAVTHVGGDTFESGTVEVVYQNQTGSTVRATWQTPIESGDSPADSPFDAKSGTEIRVVWLSPDGEQSHTLATGRVPA